MAGKPQVTLTFAGDAAKLEKATAQAQTSASRMAEGVGKSGGRLGKSFDRMNSAAVFLTEGVSNLGDAVSTFTDLSRDGAVRADRLARAQNDVAQAAQDMEQAFADARQAQLDLNQAQRDSVQAGLDVEQAILDAEQAQADYNKAVKEHGRNSIEARQAQLDLKQAHEDVRQAKEDDKQATEDARQANLDAAQAAVDVKDAQLNLNEAQREAIPPSSVQVWSERLSALAPIIFTVIGAMQLFTAGTIASTAAAGIAKAATVTWTAVQWLLNVALTANPIGIIIVAIGLLVGAIIWIATKTTWFQTAWKWAWGGIKKAAVAVWEWLKDLPGKIGRVFVGIAEFIGRPFRAAFNMIANAWNNTVGRLSFTVPSWIPGIGGNSFSAPTLPTFKFHAGGVVPGASGTEVMAVLQAGERVVPNGGGAGGLSADDFLGRGGAGLERIFVDWLEGALRRNNLRIVRA